MDPRIQAYLDIVEFFRKQDLLKELELGNLLLQAREVPFPEHVRPATTEDIVPGAIIWYTDAINVGWSIVEGVWGADTGRPTYSFNNKRYGLIGAYIEVTK